MPITVGGTGSDAWSSLIGAVNKVQADLKALRDSYDALQTDAAALRTTLNAVQADVAAIKTAFDGHTHGSVTTGSDTSGAAAASPALTSSAAAALTSAQAAALTSSELVARQNDGT